MVVNIAKDGTIKQTINDDTLVSNINIALQGSSIKLIDQTLEYTLPTSTNIDESTQTLQMSLSLATNQLLLTSNQTKLQFDMNNATVDIKDDGSISVSATTTNSNSKNITVTVNITKDGLANVSVNIQDLDYNIYK